MARTATKNAQKTVRKNPAPVVTDDLKPEQQAVETMQEENSIAENSTNNVVKQTRKTAYRVRDMIPGNAIVTVRNGFNGKLNYKSRKTGEVFVWERFGDEQDMEFQELKNARNSYRSFFENNWFLFDDPEVIDCLDVKQYYKNALSYDDFDAIFELSADQISDRISKLSNGQKATLAYRAKQLIREGGIDSIRVINAIEGALGVELIER